MANTTISLPKSGKSGGQTVPILAVDNGDGTYSLGVSTGTASAISVAFPLATGFGGQTVAVATVDNMDGTYSLKVSES